MAEISAGVFSLLPPVPLLLVCTELLRPAWELVERASNMVAPLALLAVRHAGDFLRVRRA